MKITNDRVIGLGDSLTNQLVSYRKERDFNPARYINKKVAVINEYLTKHNLDTIVVASSGGVDSAVAAALSSLTTAKVKMVTVPCFDNDGVTRQEDTMHLSQELANSLGIDLTVLEITGVVDAASHVIGDDGKSPWSVGQSVPYLRTAVVYSYISRLWEMGHRAIFMGTTNFDEGGYLGYIGKASDGMVDVQPISDIHKSEVYQVAHELNIPQSIIGAIPQGDMYSGQSDEEVFGVSYDGVELFMASKMGFEVPDCPVWEMVCERLEDMHTYNLHKYLGASPAVHLDIMDNPPIEGGWITRNGVE